MKIQNYYHDLIESETREVAKELKTFRCTGFVVRKIDIEVHAPDRHEAIEMIYRTPCASFKLDDMHVEATEVETSGDASGQD